MVLKKPTCGGAILITVKLVQTLIKCTTFPPLVGNVEDFEALQFWQGDSPTKCNDFKDHVCAYFYFVNAMTSKTMCVRIFTLFLLSDSYLFKICFTTLFSKINVNIFVYIK